MVLRFPEGWGWVDNGQTHELRLVRKDNQIVLTIGAEPDGATVGVWFAGHEICEHKRIYEWSNPTILEAMMGHLNWLAYVWGMVADFPDIPQDDDLPAGQDVAGQIT